MSDQRIEEYREYYRARARRYEGDERYPLTAAAERAMADAADAASSVEDLQPRIVGDGLHLACGKALVRDQGVARAALYDATGEVVRAQAPTEVLARVDEVDDPAALASLANDVEVRCQQEVVLDELTRLWTAALPALENIEVWRTAVVPDRWRAELDGFATEAATQAREAWVPIASQAAELQPGWRLDDAVARQDRHRRLLPLPDALLEQRLAEHRTIVRGKG